ARLLRDWILHPLRDLEAITRRQDLVAAFHDDPTRLAAVRDILTDEQKSVFDAWAARHRR
ncbi:MAG: hypothetical protein ACKOBV_02105, partial [Candidatus Kapaibacterium sp.]